MVAGAVVRKIIDGTTALPTCSTLNAKYLNTNSPYIQSWFKQRIFPFSTQIIWLQCPGLNIVENVLMTLTQGTRVNMYIEKCVYQINLVDLALRK